MKKILQTLENKINQIDKTTHNDKLKLEILRELEKLTVEVSMADFKISKALKDKNILNSLLAKTSGDLENALKNLKNQKDELNILLDTIPAMVYFKDSHFRYRLANKAFLDLSGTTKEALAGKTLQEVFKDYLLIGDYEKLEELVIGQGKFFFNVEEQLKKKHKTIWVHTNIAPVRNHKDEIIGLIGVSWDITDQKKYEHELTHSKELAEESELIKDRFLTNMSHELRTPLNGVMGMADILEKTSLNKKQHEYLKILQRSGDHLVSLINDIFAYSSLEKGEIKLLPKNFNLRKLIKSIVGNFKDTVSEKAVKVQIEIDKNIPEVVKGDSILLGSILRQLYSNALKFTEKGRITLRAFSVSRPALGRLTLRFEVEDTGIGIRKPHISRLFGSFSQLDTSSTKIYQGTGLGLAISKKLTDLLNGEIGVESEWKKGSKFWLIVPLTIEDKGKEGYSYDKELVLNILHGFHILLVEDNLINQKITKLTLEKAGCNVNVANNGKEGFEKYKQNFYDLILMDIQMPVLDGLGSTRKIREFERTKNNRHAFIIALTANALKEDREKALVSGMDGFITKPFKPDELFQLLYNFITKK